jgi:RNA polymerase sigma-70 factor (ECF subfamily)
MMSLVNPPLEALAKRAVSERRAEEALLLAVAPMLLGVVRAVRGATHPDVEDLLQETLMAISRSLDQFRGEGGFRQYAARIAVRTVLQSRRRERAQRRAAVEVELSDDIPAEGSPALELSRARQRAAFRDLLDELPSDQAEALILRNVLGHSVDEIALAARVSRNTIRSRLRLAKQGIRQRVEADAELRGRLGVSHEL